MTDIPRKVRCPHCGKSFEFTRIANHKPFPFCSSRCKDIDLGNWVMGKYAIPDEEPHDPDPTGKWVIPDVGPTKETAEGE